MYNKTKIMTVAALAGAVIVAAGCGTTVVSSPSQTAPNPASSSQTASPSESAQASRTPGPRPVSYSGVGSKVLKISKGSDPMAVKITHVGSSNFAVTNLSSDGQEIDLLVNTIGNYSGTRLIDALNEQQTAAFKIEADGNWRVTLEPLSMLPVWHGTGTWTGRGDNIVLIGSGSFAGLDSVKITNSGQGNFVVTAYGDTVDLLVNEIGNYSGEQLMPDGTVLLEIQSDGTWTLHKA